MVLLLFSCTLNFNPRSREGSDRSETLLPLASSISIHAPAKGATNGRIGKGTDHSNFNPRSREGSDPDRSFCLCNNRISIHAPAKGATGYIVKFFHAIHISIHAPAKGATQVLAEGVETREDFNPRSREGSDCNFP